tara:strand:+ start:2039 stop:2356 length:318 start_codon:yes stop_codon:yes gene_type:complete
MEKIKKLLLFMTLISFLYSCGGASDAAKVLRNEKIRNTDEFFVKKRDPLILPPDYNTLPKPNTEGMSKKKDSNDKIGKILKITEEENPVSGSSSVEESIIKNIKK